MDKTKYIKSLALQYFAGKLQREKEVELYYFINEDKRNMSLFREWEKEWMKNDINDEGLNDLWVRLENRIDIKDEKIPSKTKKIIELKKWLSVAASIIIVISLSFYIYNNLNQDYTSNYFISEVPNGYKNKLTLPDGSIVWLNNGSSLKYPNNFSKKNRHVILNGEGYFEVAKNEGYLFTVSTSNYDIVVKGTKFNVCAYENDNFTSTSLIEGKVEIKYKEEQYEMFPGDEIVLDETTGTIKRYKKDVNQSFSWINNRFEYENITFKDLAKKLSRRYDLNIIIEDKNLSNKMFNISLRNDESIDQVLNAINKIQPFKYKRINQTIFINN